MLPQIFAALASPQCPLEYIDLSGNQLGDEGVVAFAAALADSPRLLNFCIDHNQGRVPGFNALAAAITKQKRCHSISCLPIHDVMARVQRHKTNNAKLAIIRQSIESFEAALEKNALLAANAGSSSSSSQPSTPNSANSAEFNDPASHQRTRSAFIVAPPSAALPSTSFLGEYFGAYGARAMDSRRSFVQSQQFVMHTESGTAAVDPSAATADNNADDSDDDEKKAA